MEKGFTNFIKKHWLFLSIIISIIVLGLYSYFHEGVIFSLINGNPKKTLDFINSFGIFAWLIFVLLVIFEVILAPIPPLVLYIIAGLLFGGFLGGVLTLFGNSIGAFIDFKIARKFGKSSVEKNLNRKLKIKFDKFFEKYGSISIFLLRINPLTTSDLVSYLSGLTQIKTWKFLLATTLGLIPMIFLQTYLGDILIKDNPLLLGVTVAISILYLAIFGYLIIISIAKKHNNDY